MKHIVCFKLIESSEKEKNAAKDILLSMKGNVPQILDIEVGVDFLGSARSYDILLQVTLADRASLEDYQKDPYHCDVVKTYMHAHTASSVAIDYEL